MRQGPPAVMIEQVPRFLQSPVASGMFMGDLFEERFASLGCDMHSATLNAAAFGVAQRRLRTIAVCLPKGSAFRYPFSLLGSPKTVGEAIDDLPAAVPKGAQPMAPNHVDVTPTRDRERISHVPEGSWLSKVADVPPDILGRLTRKDTTKYRRLARHQPSLTLRCGEALFHPTLDRLSDAKGSGPAARLSGLACVRGAIRRRTGTAASLNSIAKWRTRCRHRWPKPWQAPFERRFAGRKGAMRLDARRGGRWG